MAKRLSPGDPQSKNCVLPLKEWTSLPFVYTPQLSGTFALNQMINLFLKKFHLPMSLVGMFASLMESMPRGDKVMPTLLSFNLKFGNNCSRGSTSTILLVGNFGANRQANKEPERPAPTIASSPCIEGHQRNKF